MKQTALTKYQTITPPLLYIIAVRSRHDARNTARLALGLLSHTRIPHTTSLPADTRSLRADRFPASGKDEFYPQENSTRAFCKTKKADDAFPQFGNMLAETSDTPTHSGKMLSEASDTSAQSGKALSEASDASAQFGKVLSEASDASAHFGKALSETSDGFAQFGKVPSETSDASAHFCAGKKHQKETTAAYAAASSYQIKEYPMKEIQSLPLTSMNNAAHFLFVSNMADRAEKDAAVSEKCAAQVKALREAVKVEDENLQTSAKSLTTDKIAEADRLRDQLYAGYKKAVAGYADFPVESLAEAAKVLQQHVKDYKIDPKAQLDKETGLLVNFIQDLESKYKPQVEALSLTAFVEKLKAANEDVRALTGQRTDERSAKTAGALKAARTASDEAYRMLVLHVNAHALLEGEADYAAFIDYANTEIEHFKKEVLK